MTGRTMRSCLLGGMAAAMLFAGPALAAASQTGGTLAVTGSFADDSIQIRVGPFAGDVAVFGVPGIADGTVFTGVDRLEVSTENGGDTVEFDIETDAVQVWLNTGSGADSVKIEMRTPAGAVELAAAFTIFTGTNSDSVELKLDSRAAEVALAVDFDTSTNSDQVSVLVEQQVPGNVAIDVNGTLSTNSDSFKLVAVGPALFAVSGSVDGGVGADGLAAEIDGDAAGTLVLDGSAGDDSVEYVAKGNLNGSPRMLGGSNSDSVKLLAEGAVTGSPLVDGGAFTDSCDASAGVTVQNCE